MTLSKIGLIFFSFSLPLCKGKAKFTFLMMAGLGFLDLFGEVIDRRRYGPSDLIRDGWLAETTIDGLTISTFYMPMNSYLTKSSPFNCSHTSCIFSLADLSLLKCFFSSL